MAGDNQRSNDFTEDELKNFKQKLRNQKLALLFAARLNDLPSDDKEEKMMEYIEKENEQQNMNTNKWMIICPTDSMSECSIEVQFDTCATLNFMTEGMVQDLGLKKERLKQPIEFKTAAGPGKEFICEYRVIVNWRGKPGSQGYADFLVLPERSPVTKPLIGTEQKKDCWDKLSDEQPKDVVLYTALSTQKPQEKTERATLRAAVLSGQSELQSKKEAHEERRGGGGSRKPERAPRSNEKKTRQK